VSIDAWNGELLDDGWYTLVLHAWLPGGAEGCNIVEDTDMETAAVINGILLDQEEPDATLVTPGGDDYLGAAFLTGQAVLLQGEVWDKWGISAVTFEICGEAWDCLLDWQSDDWQHIADGVQVTGLDDDPAGDQVWNGTWDSTGVYDGFYFIRVCAYDLAGNTNCEDPEELAHPMPAQGLIQGEMHLNPWPDAHWVWVENRTSVDVVPGWNLISTPYVPYDTSIESVLEPLIDANNLEMVGTQVWDGTQMTWQVFTPPAPGGDAPNSLTDFMDGVGYWVKVKTEQTFDIVGTWNSDPSGTGGPAIPIYSVQPVPDYNLIGFTSWGRPGLWWLNFTMFPNDTVREYLGNTLTDGILALYFKDPNSQLWVDMGPDDHMWPGLGYVLAVEQAGYYVP